MALAIMSIDVPGVANMIQTTILTVINLDILMADEWLTPFLNSLNFDKNGVAIQSEDLSIYL
jgi:hypothetical protein